MRSGGDIVKPQSNVEHIAIGRTGGVEGYGAAAVDLDEDGAVGEDGVGVAEVVFVYRDVFAGLGDGGDDVAVDDELAIAVGVEDDVVADGVSAGVVEGVGVVAFAAF